jgi:ATP-dependent Lon protease
VLHTIPRRCGPHGVIQLAGYTEDEKVEIAKQFLVPKQIEARPDAKENITFTDDAISTIIRATRAKPASATSSARSRNDLPQGRAQGRVEGKEVQRSVDHRREGLTSTSACRSSATHDGRGEERDRRRHRPGLDRVGGEISDDRSTLMPGKGKLTLTGKLGDVMQESAQAAMSYVRARAEEFGICPATSTATRHPRPRARGRDPEGRPVGRHHDGDGDRLGADRIPVRRDVAMTGEITLRGKVLPIGGLKEKLLAALAGATGMRKQELIFKILKAQTEPTASASCARPTTTTCPAPTTSTSRRRRSAASACAPATPSRARSAAEGRRALLRAAQGRGDQLRDPEKARTRSSSTT